ncbi:CBS domain-containing protein [Rhodococcus phenolicus]|uniref:CBS domain-containing protein n=1 Tax=Rhodococcus phenolicus TaxID=263849 RepID=UPI00083010E1|nr:CBS domain-containing protein [Rhodococcus phenolicus]
MRIADVLRNKGRTVVTVPPTATVRDVVEVLTTRNLGALVVLEDAAPIGIVTERDVVRLIHVHGPGVLEARVSDVMTTSMYTCLPSDSVDSLAATMTERRIRHLPVLVDGRLAGIVSIGDVVKSRIDELQSERDHLESYIDQG